MAEIYESQILKLYGVPKSIISDHDRHYTPRLWTSVHTAMKSKLKIGMAFHPLADDQSERIIQTLEDMLKSCILDYGRKCRSLIYWQEV